MTDLHSAARLLNERDDYVILSHASPDGDTVGSAYALCHALHKLGKRARVECSDPIPTRYDYFTERVESQQFEAGTVVAVDVASTMLLGKLRHTYGDGIWLCIDHHESNDGYAEHNFVLPDAAANCENIFRVIEALGVQIDGVIADALFTGVSTDTGCFRYGNCTGETHRIAARLMELGADAENINRLMFETKSRARIEVERQALESIEYHFDNRCAVMLVTAEMRRALDQSEIDGLAALPRQIEGVTVGVTMREMDDCYKISLRTHAPLNASEICARLGGGGHARAAGCSLKMPLDEAKAAVLAAVKAEMEMA